MAGHLDQVLGEFQAVAHAPLMAEIANEPLVIVGVVVDLVGHHVVAHHVGMIGARGGLLLPGGVVVTLQLRKRVPRHVPHMRDARGRLTAQRRRLQRSLRLFVVPEVNAVVMDRVHRVPFEHLIDQRIDRLVAAVRNLAAVQPNDQHQISLGFQVVGVLVDDVLDRLDERLPAGLVGLRIGLGVFVVGAPSIDPELLAARGLGPTLDRLFDELGGPLGVVDVGGA